MCLRTKSDAFSWPEWVRSTVLRAEDIRALVVLRTFFAAGGFCIWQTRDGVTHVAVADSPLDDLSEEVFLDEFVPLRLVADAFGVV
jgi:hypothetical protein